MDVAVQSRSKTGAGAMQQAWEEQRGWYGSWLGVRIEDHLIGKRGSEEA